MPYFAFSRPSIIFFLSFVYYYFLPLFVDLSVLQMLFLLFLLPMLIWFTPYYPFTASFGCIRRQHHERRRQWWDKGDWVRGLKELHIQTYFPLLYFIFSSIENWSFGYTFFNYDWCTYHLWWISLFSYIILFIKRNIEKRALMCAEIIVSLGGPNTTDSSSSSFLSLSLSLSLSLFLSLSLSLVFPKSVLAVAGMRRSEQTCLALPQALKPIRCLMAHHRLALLVGQMKVCTRWNLLHAWSMAWHGNKKYKKKREQKKRRI